MSAGRTLAIAASMVVGVTVIASIWVMGTPSVQRDMKLDGRRIDDLNRIAQVIEQHVDLHGTLPAGLPPLAAQPGQRLAITDPLDGSAYGYQATGRRSYRLCAVFATDTALAPAMGGPWNPDDWNHPAGRHCFERTVKPRPD